MNKTTNQPIRRAIISGGGTGGHIFPALSIADALRRRYPDVEILFIGANGRMEMTRIPEAGYRIIGLPVEGLKRSHLWENFRVIKNYIVSLRRAKAIIKDFQPDVAIGVGGYASAPTLKAAQSLGIPTLIQEQNSYAGVTNKFLAKGAHCICVAYPDMERFFPANKIIITGNPIRPQLEFMEPNRQEALEYFGLKDDGKPIVLIIGGSLGARTINESIGQHLDAWSASGATLIWQTGASYASEAEKMLEGYTGQVFCSAFIQRMDYAYQLASLVISRAGASSISELELLGKACILVPSPNVAEDHQSKNALALSTRGAAILITDAEARTQLTPKAISLLGEQDTLRKLETEIRKLAHGNAANHIVDAIEQIL